MATQLRSLPSVDKVLADGRVQRLVETYSRGAVVDLVREQLAEARQAAQRGEPAATLDAVVEGVAKAAGSRWEHWPLPVINATGVILHTNLGRAPLSDDARAAVQRVAASYSNLEFDLDTGRRGSRQGRLSQLLAQLTGAEAALAVNNNASAVMLGLAAVAAGKQVIVSRGEAVEIGGGFRIPDVLRQSGAELVEVGTTNRTYAQDYENAVTERTGAILAVHASNFRVVGFTHAPTIPDLVELGRKHGIPVLHDLGSGCLLDTSQFGLAKEPMPQDSIASGVGLAFFSGDKMLGGPQAGIVAGTKELVGKVSRHPLARAVRMDKLSMAALVATLLHYVRGEATDTIPIWRMIATPLEDLDLRAQRWRASLGGGASVVDGASTVGGGSLPGETLSSRLLCLQPSGAGGVEALAARLRRASPPVIGRIEDGRLLLDPRTVLPEEEDALVRALKEALR